MLRLSDFSEEDFKFLKITDLENMFDISKDSKGHYVFNLNSTLYFNADSSSLLKHIIKTKAHWPLASYLIYGTTRLAWLLMKLNDVKANEVFNLLYPGDIVYYLPKDSINSILSMIN